MKQSVEQAPNSTRHIVIVGGGFAGLHCAQKLAANPDVRVTLLDKNNYQQFQPLLYQVASSLLAPGNIAFNLRVAVKNRQNVDIRLTEAVSVDLKSRTVETADGQHYQGDYLVWRPARRQTFSVHRERNRTATLYIPFATPSGCVRDSWPCSNR